MTPRVTVITAEPPLIEGGAAGRCAVGLLRGLMSHGVDVTAIAARQHFSIDGTPPGDLPVTLVDLPRHKAGSLTRARAVFRPIGDLGRPPFMEHIRRAVVHADIVHLEEIATAWCDLGLVQPSLVHIQYRVHRDQDFGTPWSPTFRHALEFALAERAAIRRHRWLVANSPLVAQSLKSANPKADVVVVPLSLDPLVYEQAPLDEPVVGIIGTAGWAPTAAAMHRLITTVWPQIRARVPKSALRVAGRGTDSLVDASNEAGVEVLGEVESSARFLRTLSVLLYPIARGSGTKVKVVEALACGVPVVTTPAGAEGITANDGMIVTGGQGLVEAAARLLQDQEERLQRGRAARAAFERHHTPHVATAPLVELYGRMSRT